MPTSSLSSHIGIILAPCFDPRAPAIGRGRTYIRRLSNVECLFNDVFRRYLFQRIPLSILGAYEIQGPDKLVVVVSVSSDRLGGYGLHFRAVTLSCMSAPCANKVSCEIGTWSSKLSAALLELPGTSLDPFAATLDSFAATLDPCAATLDPTLDPSAALSKLSGATPNLSRASSTPFGTSSGASS